MATFIPARVVPSPRPLGRAAFVATFIRNPLEVVPQSVYEEDYVAIGGKRAPRVWVTSPAFVKGVLLDQRDKFRKLTQIRLLSPLLGKGILTSEGAHWRWQRAAAAPMFRPQDIGAFVPAFVQAAAEMLARWRADAPGTVRNVEEDMTRVTFDVIAATLLPSADQAFRDEVQRSVQQFQRFGGWELLYAQLNLPRRLPRPGMFGGPRAVRRLRSMVTELLRARIASGADPDDLLHRLIAARDPETGGAMDEQQLVDNLLTFYLAGHETTAKALTWTLYLLARSPEWMAALEGEIAGVTGGAPLEAAHLDRLVLVQQVIKESMRLYPPAPMMSRQCVEDCEIEGHAIPAGTSVLMPIYAIHRHARRWERPDEFDPTRFAPAAEEAMPRYQFMPFGAGPRVCIGRSFAHTEATAILAALVAGARFEAVAGHEPTPIARVTLIPKGGMPLRVFASAR